ncbi:hypothetical protein CDS [Bradyrhizobium sp.]|uniref:hypothetical protein n=1 Tax=Bradyrhizobium sp. TaxID=376 RepID=UPI0007C18E66|nr:hypothetical protein [Bradyrhizobium sp.]CUU14762.1 hypothetical protein CDS [Bradyrhizobium sp.]
MAQSQITYRQWTIKKAELRAKGYDWLPVLLDGASTLDVVINAAAAKAKSIPINPYDPYRVEQLLGDVSRLLDRIFSYRKEGYDLDIAATTWALDYQLFKDQLAGQIALEQLSYVGDQKQIERDAQEKARNAFAGSADNLAQGFKEAAEGSRRSSDVAVAGETDRRSKIQAKWDRLAQHQDDLQARHAMPGGSLNFGDRLTRLQALLSEDVCECYLKAIAANLGLEAVYGIVEPLPAPDELPFLDKLLSWTRKVLRRLEIDQQGDVDFEHIIPLSLLGVAYSGAMQAGGSGILSVDLTNYFDSLLGKLWVRGVALSLAVGNPGDVYHRVFRATGEVFPPPTRDLYDPRNYLARAPVILSAIALDDPGVSVKMYRGPNINNLNPRGVWTIIINKNFSAGDEKPHPREPNSIRDIRLHLLLTGRPEQLMPNWHALQF